MTSRKGYKKSKKLLERSTARKAADQAKGFFKNIWRVPIWRRLMIALGISLGIFLLASWFITYTDTYKRIPGSVWERGDLRSVALMAALLSPEQRRQLDSIQAAGSRAATNATPLMAKAAEAWTKAINENNPGAILQSEADSYGHLYLVLGVWWDTAEDNHRIMALDAMGSTWREYLRRQFPVIAQTNFKPGIFIVDDRGKIAQNVNGRVELLRR